MTPSTPGLKSERHRIRVSLPGLQTSTLVAPDLDVADLDWREVIRLEALATRKAQRAPTCRYCGQPMMCGQNDTHLTCRR